jgi:hypothetical protein
MATFFDLVQSQQTEGATASPMFFPVRVREVILDGSNEDLGGWNALGYIKFDAVDRPTKTSPLSSNIARPLLSNIKNFPLVNEIVFLFTLPDTDLQENTNSETYYYISAINLWNSPNHNAIPDNVNYSELPESQQKDYDTTVRTGTVRRVTDKGTDIDLGKTFTESSQVYPLRPYEGDIIYESRFGSSMRLGSTVKGATTFWKGQSGPITILSNGHNPSLNQFGWLPTSESIDKDQTTVVLTSNQTLSYTLTTFGSGLQKFKVQKPDTYSDPQLVLSSDRIVLNAKGESIIGTGAKSINLSSTNVAVEATDTFLLDGSKVYLGLNSTTYPDEPVILGKTFLNDFQQLLSRLDTLASRLQNFTALPEGTPYIGISTAAGSLKITLEKLDKKLKAQTYQSKKVFTGK